MEKSVCLTKELSHGQDLAKQLQSLLFHSSSPPEMRDFLLQSILSCYDRALSSLVLNAQSEEPFDPSSSGKRHRGDPLKRKRKDEAGRTEMVRRLEGGQQEGDCYSWRKYGQKRILDAKYPRGYFRCTHRPVQGCLATKMVQRSDNDPSVFQVTYRGRHTCIPPISYKLDQQDPILSPPSILDAEKTGQMNVKEQPGITAEENFEDKGTYSDALAEQGTLLDDFDFYLDQVLAPTWVAHSPVVFPLQELGFDQEFQFDDLEFFS